MKRSRKTGQEQFTCDAQPVPFQLLDFWQWSGSDLVSNVTRGRLADYIVAKACAIETNGVRDEWQAFDLITSDNIKVEVKSAAYVQSWKQKQPSTIRFGCPETLGWSSENGCLNTNRKRHADVYVFALLAHTDAATVDPLNLNQWTFYVCRAETLNLRKYRSIGLASLQRLCPTPQTFQNLGIAVARLGGPSREADGPPSPVRNSGP